MGFIDDIRKASNTAQTATAARKYSDRRVLETLKMAIEAAAAEGRTEISLVDRGMTSVFYLTLQELFTPDEFRNATIQSLRAEGFGVEESTLKNHKRMITIKW